ncbi:hypothetical protein H4R24_002776 [Coemansia sp. RSA 988]|nr:hypothetical protein H4R24_002776 [Coemansia sp. RSA 988]
MREALDEELLIKLGNNALVDQDYVIQIIKKYRKAKNPVDISDSIGSVDRTNPDTLHNVDYGNGKFYMFNRHLTDCLDLGTIFQRRMNEEATFGDIVNTGCSENNVKYIRENDSYIWHKECTSKNKYIDLAYIKNH